MIDAVRDELSQELLAIHEDSYGRSAERVTVIYEDDAIIAILDGLELQRSEEFLIASGHAESVLELRSCFQQAMESTFKAAVERSTGRRVVSFASATKLDPNYAVEIFRLAPAD